MPDMQFPAHDSGAYYHLTWKPIPGAAWPGGELSLVTRSPEHGPVLGGVTLGAAWQQTGDSLALGEAVGLPNLGAVHVVEAWGDVDADLWRAVAVVTAAHLGSAVSASPSAWAGTRSAPGDFGVNGALLTRGGAGFWCHGDGSPRSLFVSARPALEDAFVLASSLNALQPRPENLHLTMGFYGRFAATDPAVGALVRVVAGRPWWGAGGPASVPVQKVELLKDRDGDSLQLLMDRGAPAAWRYRLLEGHGPGAPSLDRTHPFRPHVTLAHGPPGSLPPVDRIALPWPQRVRFDSVWCCVGRRCAAFPL